MSVEEWYVDKLSGKVIEALQKNGFDAVYFSRREEAAQYLLSLIKPGMTVGFGGSVTVKELGIPVSAKEKGAVVLDHGQPGLTPEQILETRRQQLLCDLFLSSVNAVTLNGELVNVDGTGNRVAAMTFGPKQVVAVAGVNKICRSLEDALERIKLVASPMNNKRVGLPNPCATTGVCTDCDSKTRACRIYSVIKKKPFNTNFTVVLVGESLGY